MIQRLLTVGRTGRLLSLLALLVISVAASLQLGNLKVDRSDDRLISRNDAGWAQFRQLQADFGSEESVLVYLRAADLWTKERLLELQQVVLILEGAPQITAVKSLLEATNIRDKGDFVEAGPLMPNVPLSEDQLAELRDDALYSPIMRRNFISPDGLATMISIGYDSDPADPDHELRMFELIERTIAPLREHFESVFQLGRPRLNVEIDTGLFKDLRELIPLSIVIVVITMTLFLKSVRLVPVPLVTSGISLLWTFGFMAAVGIPLTLLTAMIPALIIVVGSVEDIHLLSAYLDGVKSGDGSVRARAIEHMAKHVGLPILITSLTTATGFIANTITEIPLIFEFAIASAFAMVANLVVTTLSIPLLLHACGPEETRLKRDEGVPGGFVGGVVRVVEFTSERYPVMVIAGAIVLVVALGSNIPNVRVNNDPLSYFPHEHPFVLDAHTVHEDLAGLQVFSVTLKSSTPGLFKTPEGIRKIAAVQTLLDRQGLYDKTLSLADLMSLMHQEMHKGNGAYFKVPDRQDDVDLYLSALTRNDLKSFVTEDYASARISVRHNLANSVRLNQAVDEVLAMLPTILGPDIDYAMTGRNLMANRAAESLMKGQISSLLLILFIIFVLFSVLYTSWLAGLLSLVPNIIPIVINFGLMGLLGVPLNPGTAMVAAIAIGLAVDDTIHLMARFGAESKLHLDERDAVRATIRGESVPIVSTSVALALGFAALALSHFSIVAQFGLLAAATMIYAAIADLLMMPILLRHLRLATVWDIVALQLDRNVLVNCPLFTNMSQFAIKKVVVLSHIQDFKPQDIIIEQGTVSSGMYVVLEGTAEIKVQRDDLMLYLGDTGPGEVFGEIGFSGEGVQRTASIIAREPVSVVRLDSESIQKGLRFYPRISARLHQNISNVLAARLIESHDRLADNIRIHVR